MSVQRIFLKAWFADGSITLEFDETDPNQWQDAQVIRVFSEDDALKIRRGEFCADYISQQLSLFNRMVDALTSTFVTLGYTTGDGTLVVEVLT